ncbi:MAG: HlyD family secretion protein [Bryobacteraceae bacterium]|jgi:membrane fusion protein (multidrug efflux system)
MPDLKETPPQAHSFASRLKQWLVPAIILLLAVGIVLLITTNWNAWAGGRAVQETDDAYLHADLTPLSTKVAGLVSKVAVSDYQAVKAGDLLVTLRDDDFSAQVQQAEASVSAAEAAVVNNRKQKLLQDARIVEAEDGVRTANANIAAAQAGIEAANASIAGARGGIESIQANVTRTSKERKRQEALIATESTTPQKLEQAVSDDENYRSQLLTRNADLSTANAQLSSRQADLERARSQFKSAQSEVEAQRRQREVLDSQELQLRATVELQKASLALAKTNLGYTKIVAPEDGIVSERLVRPGQLVSPGTQVISLVQDDTWVQANFLENQIRGIKRGDAAEIRVDAIPGVILRGRVEEVAPASGSQFALLPPDNATGNFTKIAQRIRVKIVLDRDRSIDARLRPGLSVIVRVHTNSPHS